jgi:hypothetical protein
LWNEKLEVCNATQEVLMSIDKPLYLYKFCSVERAVQVLSDLYLYLCPAVELNDMHEGSIKSILHHTAENAFELQVRFVQIESGYDIDEAREFVRSAFTQKELDDAYFEVADAIRNINFKMRQHSGVTCFTARGDDQRMWGTYGDNHRGVCIQFHNSGPASLIASSCLPVFYSDQQDEGKLSSLLADDGTLNVNALASLCYLRKSHDWRDEREWRILMTAVTPQDLNARKATFMSQDVAKVFLGPRVAQKDASEIMDLCNKRWPVYEYVADMAMGTTDLAPVELRSASDLAWQLRSRDPGSET